MRCFFCDDVGVTLLAWFDRICIVWFAAFKKDIMTGMRSIILFSERNSYPATEWNPYDNMKSYVLCVQKSDVFVRWWCPVTICVTPSQGKRQPPKNCLIAGTKRGFFLFSASLLKNNKIHVRVALIVISVWEFCMTAHHFYLLIRSIRKRDVMFSAVDTNSLEDY